MRKSAAIASFFLFALHLAPAADPAYVWNLPKGFPKPHVPADNPITPAKVELGRYLFYDVRLSANGKTACATCHKQELAFTDGRPTAVGTTGQAHPRGSMSLVNVAYSAALAWGNPQLKTLEQQALVPMFGEHPVELGLRDGDGFLPMLRGDARYRPLFAGAFPDDTDPFTIANVTKALASFERTIISARSPYDRYHYDRDDAAVPEAAKRGEILFFNQRLHCFRCHSGFNFSGDSAGEANPGRTVEFHNTGLSYAPPNTGIFEFTRVPADLGKFKVPTLRNIAITAPYMHDGSIATLAGVLDHYAAGGHAHPNKDPLIGGFDLTPQDREDLIAFLQTLTDTAVLRDPRFANPW